MDKKELIKIVKDLAAHRDEQDWFEFKVDWFNKDKLGKYISGMSNVATMRGEKNAFFIWGVENETHKIVGTKFNYNQSIQNEPLEHWLARQITPDIAFSFDECKVDGERVVVLTIPAAKRVPTEFAKERFFRIGSSLEKLNKYPQREAQLFDVLQNGLPTMEETESKYQELTFDQLLIYYSVKGVTLNKRTFKKNLGLLTSDGKYNLLAQLLSDNSHIPIRFAIFNGKTKGSSMYSVREFGNMCLLNSLDKVIEYGEVWNIPQADERNRKVVRKEVDLFNKEAYNEAVINAFVHNDWLAGNAPMFTAFSNRIEITSHGDIPIGQTKSGFLAGVSVPRNQKLSDMILQLHISERTGRGVPKITEIYGEDTIDFNDGFITVTVPFNRLGSEVYGDLDTQVTTQVTTQVDTQVSTQVGMSEIKRIEEKILDYCSVPRSMMEIAEYLNFKERKSARKYVVPLLEEGRLALTIPDKPKSRLQKYITIK